MIRLPPTSNAEEIWAFKKGYRFALEGRPLREMPFNVRTHRNLKAMFEQGYAQGEQTQHRRTQPSEMLSTPRKRLLWLVLTLFAGLATAKLMISDIQETTPSTASTDNPALPHIPDTQRVQQTPENTVTTAQTAPREAEHATITPPPLQKPTSPATPITAAAPPLDQQTHTASQDFRLLDEEARLKAQAPHQVPPQLPPVATTAAIEVSRALLAANIQAREPVGIFEDIVPKSVRKLYFFTEIHNAQGKQIIHRWRYGARIMAEVPLEIKTARFRTWSSKRLSPAWAGRWWVEVVDEQGQVIIRKAFRYVR